MQNSKSETRGGNRKSSGKRKLSDHDPGHCTEPARKQKTISDLFTRGTNNLSYSKDRPLSPTDKSFRSGRSPQSQTASALGSEPIAPDKMYNFSNTDSKVSGAVGLSQSPPGTCAGTVRTQAYASSPRASNFTPHTGAKKLVVKNLRVIPRLDQDQYFEKVWSQLDSALTAIFNNEKPTHSLEELYKGAENVCRQGRASILAKKLQQRCKNHIYGKILDLLLAKSDAGSDVDTLRAVEEAWSLWNSRLVTVRSIFYYLDQSFLLHSSENPVIYEMGLVQFRSFIFSDKILKPKILQGACSLIQLDRKEDNTVVDPALLRRAISLFHDLGTYATDFEPCMVAASEIYLKSWADHEAAVNRLATYADKSHRLIEHEMDRCVLFALDRSTRQSLSEMLDRSLVADQTSVLLDERDVLGLLRANDRIALEQLYSLLERISLGSKLKSAFCVYIIEEGSSIVFDQEREADMVFRLLEFKQNLDNIWKKSFHKNETLGHCLRESFETFINKAKRTEASWGTDNPKPGEMIAKYVDMLLKGGLKAIHGRNIQSKSGCAALADEDTEINKQLDQVLDLFRFVHGKAVFEAFYKNDLARRLLMGRSASDDAEKSMLAKLKSECGSNFTHNLESMFKDMDLARDEMASYNSLLRERRNKPALDLNVNVLSAAAWPSYPDVPVKMPTAISRAIHDFDEFYNSKYSGRKLHWKHSLAHCQLKARFPKGDKELVVSSFQAIVLLLFNDVADDETLSYAKIKDATGLPDAELNRTLQSLACAKYRVLSKRPKGRDIHDGDIFSFNSAFSDPKMRIKINQIQLKETRQENKETHQRVAADRHYETQAAIVRIMKSRKVITHQELVVEVIKATKNRGVLEPADIKKNVEKLIEKDYLEREEGNRYKYLA